MKSTISTFFLTSLVMTIPIASANAQGENPACLQIPEAQTNFNFAKAKSEAALKVAQTTGQGIPFTKSAKAYYNQVKKEENIAAGILKSVTQKCGKKSRRYK